MSEVKLIITENDLSEEDRNWILEERSKVTRLGGEDGLRDKPIFDLLPKIITKRIESINIQGFKISEISLDLGISGKLFGTGFDGKATIKLTKEE